MELTPIWPSHDTWIWNGCRAGLYRLDDTPVNGEWVRESNKGWDEGMTEKRTYR